jgi:RHS repeat-associated protein
VTLLGTPNVTILNNVTYDPFGPVTGWTWGNGTASVSRAFDTDGKLTGVTNTPSALGNRSFGYDDAFRITSTTDSASGGPAWTLGYDNLDRLNSATRTGLTIGYTYDANGNRLSQTGTSASTYSVSSTSNRLTSTTGALARTYTYNNAGSALTSGATTHTYYNNGRMRTGRLGAASNTTYIYNALGQRVRKSGGGATHTLYVYDEAGHLIGEYNSSGALVQETVWLGGIPVATLRPSGSNVTVFYVHTDQLNTPRKVTNTSNQLRWRWDPNPFGEGTPNENPASLGTFRYNLRFPGQLFDSETNLNYNYFRDYDPATGRYTKSDPIGLSGGINTYAYVRGNPLSYGDPTGLAPPGRTQPGTGFPALGIPGPFDESWNQARDGAVNDIESALGALGNAIGNIGRPKDMTREEESLYDRYCKGDGDRCAALKALTMSEIVQARTKMNRMLTDPNGLYGTEGWFNHQDDLRGRVGKIFNLISLGQKMGCDMTEEIIATTGLMVPNAPL